MFAVGNVTLASSSTADVTLSGDDAGHFTSWQTLTIGRFGRVTLEAENFQVYGRTVTIAEGAGSEASLRFGGGVNALGGENISIGHGGVGRVALLGGATGYVAFQTTLGQLAGGVGEMTLSGANTSWYSPSMTVGGEGRGTVRLAAGARLMTDGALEVARFAGSSGSLIVGAAVGDAPVAPGVVQVSGVNLGAGEGGVVFNHTATNYTFAAPIRYGGRIEHLAGTTRLTASPDFWGTVEVSGGTLLVDGALNGIAHYVRGGGAIGGQGWIGTLMLQEGGMLTPGFGGVGLLSVVDDASFASGSVLRFDLGGLERGVSYDALDIGDAVQFGGTLAVTFFGDFSVSAGDVFDLFNWGNASGQFDALLLPALGGGLSWDIGRLYLDGSLSVSAIPEPATVGLLMGGAFLLVALRRRVRALASFVAARD